MRARASQRRLSHRARAMFEQLETRRLMSTTYLSDLSYAQTPTNGWGPVEKDHSNGQASANDGGTITLNGVQYSKGLGAHANSDIRYSLNGAYDRFQAAIGIDDEISSGGGVTFEVWGDSTKLYQSSTLNATSTTANIDVSVAGVTTLKLIINDGGDANNDHADWADAKLIINTPTAPSNPSATVASGTQINVGWTDNSSNETGFQVDYSTSSTFASGVTTVTTAANATSASITGLTNNTTYYFRVRAAGSGGNSSYTSTVNATTTTGNAYVSDLAFAQTPINGWGPVEKDKSNGEAAANDGHTLTLNSTTYTKGLGVHADSDVRYNLNGAYSRFQSYIGIDDEMTVGGGVKFEVWGDGTLLYQSAVMNASSTTQFVDVDVTGVNQLKLSVDDGGDPNNDHADWADAKVTITTGTIPAAPSGLSATAASSSQVNLTWTDNSTNETSFLIDYSTSSTFASGVTTVSAAANATSKSITGLSAGTTYYFRIRATNSVGSSANSSTANVTTNSGVTYVSDLSYAQTPTNGWGPVEKDKSNGESGTNDGHTLTLNGTTYTKGLGTHANSDVRYTLTGGNYTRFQSYIGIDDEMTVGGGVTFEVWGDSTRLYQSSNMTASSTTQFVDVSVAGYTTLKLIVNNGGDPNNDHADWADAKLLSGTGAVPADPTNLSPAVISTSQIDLTWTDNANNETGYSVDYSTSSTFSSFTTVTASANATSKSVTGLTANTTYYFRVYATNSSGNSGYSNVVNATTSQPDTPPAAPTNVAASEASSTSTTVNLSWTDASSNESGFKIERSTDNITFTQVGTAAANATTATDTVPTVGKVYYYRVRAYNTTGNSKYSNLALGATGVIYNVSSYGATPNDGNDDRTAITNAINAADSANADVLYFAPGIYNLSYGSSDSAISFKQGMIYLGATQLNYSVTGGDDTAGRAILRGSSNVGPAVVVGNGSTDETNVSVMGFTFDQGGLFLDSTNWNQNIMIDSNRFQIDDASKEHSAGLTWRGGGLKDSHVTNNYFTGVNGFGAIYGDNGTNLLVANNEVYNTGYGFHIDSSRSASDNTGMTVEQNIFQAVGYHGAGNGGSGLEIQGAWTNLIVQDNYYSDPAIGSSFSNNTNTYAYSIPADTSVDTIIRRNTAIMPTNAQSADGTGVRIVFEIGGSNVQVSDNYSLGGNHVIAGNGANATGSAHDNRILQFHEAPRNSNGATITYTNNGPGEIVSNVYDENGPNVQLTWDLNRTPPGRGSKRF